MDIALGTGTITATLPDGTTQVINGQNVVDVDNIRWRVYNTAPPILDPNTPYNQPNPTSVPSYKVVLHFNDNRWMDIRMGTIGNQATWTNDLTGANTAVTEIVAALTA